MMYKLTKLKMVNLLFMMVLVMPVMAQTGTVKGKVVDSENIPIIGANIIIVGTTTGTITDYDGNFSLNVPTGDHQISVSFIGYIADTLKVSITSGSEQTFDVVLKEELRELDEVVVIGYGTIKKSDLTGAVTTVNASDIAEMHVAGVDQALQGKAPGVVISANSGSPGARPTIRIRGTGTINNSDPIFVVDGMVMDPGAVNFLNPNDIENISILKDASATAIYGAQAANGVIMVTTKKGAKGAVKVNVNSYYGWQKASNWIPLVNGPDYARLKNKVEELLGNDPKFDPDTVANTNWLDAISRTAPMKNLNVSFSGGTDKATHLFSTGYFDQEGIVRTTDYKRLTVRINTEFVPKKWLKVGENLQLAVSNRTSVNENNTYNSVISRAALYNPITPIYRPDGTFATSVLNGGSHLVQRLEDELEAGNSKDTRIVGNAYIEVSFLKDFTFKSTIGGNLNYGEYRRYVPRYFFTSSDNNPNPNLYHNLRNDFNWQWENYLTYHKVKGIHDITIMAGTSASEWKMYYVNASNENGPINNDETLRYFDLFSRDNDIIRGAGDQATIYSWLGRLNYNLLDRYIITGTFRRDGSSKFGENFKFGVFPSFAGAWKISNEEFMKSLGFISFLKLRAGWGQIGNEKGETGAFEGLITIDLDYSFNGERVDGATALKPPNPSIKWETTIQKNIGFDAGLFDNRLLMNGEYFIRNTTDMIAEIDLPDISGIPDNQNPTTNIGEVQNIGFELQVQWRKLTGELQYEIGGHISRVVNKVIALGEEDAFISDGFYGQGFGPFSRTEAGYPIAAFYGFISEGIFQSYEEINAHANQNRATQPGDLKFRDLNGDGVIGAEDRTYIGNPFPNFTYGFDYNIFYKNFDLSMSWQGVYGGEIMAAWKHFLMDPENSNRNYHADILNAWTEDNPSDIPAFVRGRNNNYGTVSSYFLEDASYLRLKTAQIGYTLSDNIATKINVEKLRVYLGGQNLLTFTKYKGNDPEVGLSQGNKLVINADYLNVPQPMTFTAGFELTF